MVRPEGIQGPDVSCGADQASVELAETFATVARALLGDDVEATLLKITTLAVETIDGAAITTQALALR